MEGFHILVSLFSLTKTSQRKFQVTILLCDLISMRYKKSSGWEIGIFIFIRH